MNEGHKQCDSPAWRTTVRDFIIPWVVGDIDLGDDLIEVGPGYGATTDVLCEMVPRLTSVEIDAELAAALAKKYDGTHVEVVQGDASSLTFEDGRFSAATSFSMLHHVHSPELQDRIFSELRRVLKPGAVFAATDSLADPGLREFHEGDTYMPVDPDTLPARLEAAGFVDVEVTTNEYAWRARARTPT